MLHDNSNVWISIVHLPAVNTPQFNWVKTRLPRKPQPVPPIYQPEVAAEAIYYAAHHRRREIFVGFSTLKTVCGNRLVPGYVDQVLAKIGYEFQQYDGLVEPNRENNLWDPVPVDFGAHGDFDASARSSDKLLWVETNRRLLAVGVPALLGIFVVLIRRVAQTASRS